MKACGIKSKGMKILSTTQLERERQGLPITVTDIAKHLGVKRKTVTRWLKELPEYIEGKVQEEEELGKCDIIRKVQKSIYSDSLPKTEEGEYDSTAWLKERTPEADEALIMACKSGSPSALKLLYQLLDRLVEKTEQKVDVKVDATELAKRHIENRKWLRDNGYMGDDGVGQVQPVTPLLPDKIRED